MKSKIDWKSPVVEKEVKVSDLTKKENADLFRKIKSMRKKGLSIHFKVGEEIVFAPEKEMSICVEDILLQNGTTSYSLSCKAFIERYGVIMCPLAIFRRIPTEQYGEIREQDLLWENNALGEQIARIATDISRVEMLQGRTIKVTSEEHLHTTSVKWDEVKKEYIQSDVFKNLTCYKFEEVISK